MMGGTANRMIFKWHDREVILEADRSIKVKRGDSLSAYSMAIHGDFDHINEFTRFNREVISNKNLIFENEKIYHYGPVPDELKKNPQTSVGTEIVEVVPPPNQRAEQTPMYQFLSWLFAVANPFPDWRITGSSGGDISVAVVTGQYFNLGLQRTSQPGHTEWFHAVAGGGTIGPDTGFGGSISIAPPTMPSYGSVYKFPTALSTLDVDEICGCFLLYEFAAGVMGGAAFTLFLFGYKTPVEYIASYGGRMMAGNQVPFTPLAPAGFVAMAGTSITTPNCGFALRVGTMHRKECFV